jgi:hypothetical protein
MNLFSCCKKFKSKKNNINLSSEHAMLLKNSTFLLSKYLGKNQGDRDTTHSNK